MLRVRIPLASLLSLQALPRIVPDALRLFARPPAFVAGTSLGIWMFAFDFFSLRSCVFHFFFVFFGRTMLEVIGYDKRPATHRVEEEEK